jgi:hypothetical protein
MSGHDRPSRSRETRLALLLIGVAVLAAVLWPIGMRLLVNKRHAELATAERVEYERARARWLREASAASWWTYCQAQWGERFDLPDTPQAVAWQRALGVNGYYHEGADRRSLRLYRCSAEGVSKGPRVRHPLLQSLPLERSESTAVIDPLVWVSALAALPDASDDATTPVLAIELLRHPVEGRPLRRNWSLDGGERGPAPTPRVDTEGEAFALLLDELPLPVDAEQRPPLLELLPTRRWIEVPNDAIDVVAAAALPGSRIVELRIEPDRIHAQIGGQIPDFDDDTPAPFGALEFDEYGIAVRDWWYPYHDSGAGCEQGLYPDELKSRLAELGNPTAASMLWYSCSPAESDTVVGHWHVR